MRVPSFWNNRDPRFLESVESESLPKKVRERYDGGETHIRTKDEVTSSLV